jgi:hypothetical protein
VSADAEEVYADVICIFYIYSICNIEEREREREHLQHPQVLSLLLSLFYIKK